MVEQGPKKACFIPFFGLNAGDDFMDSTWPLTKVFQFDFTLCKAAT